MQCHDPNWLMMEYDEGVDVVIEVVILKYLLVRIEKERQEEPSSSNEIIG